MSHHRRIRQILIALLPLLKKMRRKKKNPWRLCKRSEDVDYMVAFDNPSCKVEWYRVSCVGLEQVPEDDETCTVTIAYL